MRIPVLLVLVLSCLLPLAGAAEAPSAVPSVSTDSSLDAGRSLLPPGLTADEVITKAGDVYRSARTYYEESHLTMLSQSGKQRNENTNKVVAAIKRPALCRIQVTGAYNLTFYYRDGECITLMSDLGKYLRRTTDQGISEGLGDEAPLSMLSYVAAAPDPSAAMRKIVTDTPDLSVVDFAGRKALALENRKEGFIRVLYFDPDTFRLIGAMQRQEHVRPDGTSDITHMTYTADRILLDQLPAGPDGKPLDVFSFALPEGVEEIKEPSTPSR